MALDPVSYLFIDYQKVSKENKTQSYQNLSVDFIFVCTIFMFWFAYKRTITSQVLRHGVHYEQVSFFSVNIIMRVYLYCEHVSETKLNTYG